MSTLIKPLPSAKNKLGKSKNEREVRFLEVPNGVENV
jgi:hypothetical protein